MRVWILINKKIKLRGIVIFFLSCTLLTQFFVTTKNLKNNISLSSTSGITLIGHGFGHGIGMGQWGAFGEAYLGHASYQQIINYYYSPASLASMGSTEPATVRVWIASQGFGPYLLYSASSFYLNSQLINSGAIKIVPDAGVFEVYSAANCSQNFSYLLTASSVSISANVSNPFGSQSLIYLCSSGSLIPYHGQFVGLYNANLEPALVNVLNTEVYVQDVVPAEMPANWATFGVQGPQNEPYGFQALEAQAVAVRSYLIASLGSYGFADICDTTACQAYPGSSDENELSNLATELTTGQVVEINGKVQPTYYSASTGGYSAGGIFNPVPDPFDSVCTSLICNPYHSWTVTLTAAQIQSAFPQIGQFEALSIFKRNGFGDLGGRVLSVGLIGSSSSVTVSGAQFAAALGLDSDWFGYQVGSNDQEGYYVLANTNSGSQIFSFGNLGPINDTSVVAMTVDPEKFGGWVLNSNGQLNSFGQAQTIPNANNIPTSSVVAILSDDTGTGIWVIYSNGTIYSYGAAKPLGLDPSLFSNQGCLSCSSFGGLTPLNTNSQANIYAAASDPQGQGIWVLSKTYGLIALGQAKKFYVPSNLTSELVSICTAPSGNYLYGLTSAGNIITIGFGPSISLNSQLPPGASAVSISCGQDGSSALVLDSFGDVIPAGSASFYGSLSEEGMQNIVPIGIYFVPSVLSNVVTQQLGCLGATFSVVKGGELCFGSLKSFSFNFHQVPVAIGSLEGVGLYKEIITEKYKEVNDGSP
jgi:hypothetical protein